MLETKRTETRDQRGNVVRTVTTFEPMPWLRILFCTFLAGIWLGHWIPILLGW
jgi:hypothetical protein